jgi:hypothetical protein
MRLRRGCAWRFLSRASLRALPGYRCGPDELSQALVTFARVIRCHCRLAQLASRFFDSKVVDRRSSSATIAAAGWQVGSRCWRSITVLLLHPNGGPTRCPSHPRCLGRARSAPLNANWRIGTFGSPLAVASCRATASAGLTQSPASASWRACSGLSLNWAGWPAAWTTNPLHLRSMPLP